MRVSLTNMTRLGGGRWRAEWNNSGAPVDVWSLGDKIAAGVEDDYLELTWDYPGAPALEIVDEHDISESALAGPRVVVQWRGSAGVDFYRIDIDIGSGYDWQADIVEDGRGYYWWRSAILDDGASVSVRVTPWTVLGEGEALEVSHFVIRHPERPAAHVWFDPETTELVIEAGSGQLFETI